MVCEPNVHAHAAHTPPAMLRSSLETGIQPYPFFLSLFWGVRVGVWGLVGRGLRDPQQFNFLWVDNFPLFEVDEDGGDAPIPVAV